MIKLYNKQTNEFLGRITERQLQFLRDQLEEESLSDRDYYLKRATLEEFQRAGADPNLIDLLRAAMKPGDAIEIRWEPEDAQS
jgi:hypothetical protein